MSDSQDHGLTPTAMARVDLAKLDDEMKRLRAQIAGLESQSVRLRHYIEVARKYEHLPPVSAETATVSSSSTRAIVAAAVAILQERRQPIHTRVLLEELTQRGVNVGGANPVANLSGYLCRERWRLTNSRLTGWSLKEWDNGVMA